MKPTDEHVEVAQRITLFIVGESPEECAKSLPKIAAFLAARDNRIRAEAYQDAAIESSCRREHGGRWEDLEAYLSLKSNSLRTKEKSDA